MILKTKLKLKKRKWQKYLNNRIDVNYKESKEQRQAVKVLILRAHQKSWKEFGEKFENNKRHDLIYNKTWMEERLLADWNIGIILPIHKKVSRKLEKPPRNYSTNYSIETV